MVQLSYPFAYFSRLEEIEVDLRYFFIKFEYDYNYYGIWVIFEMVGMGLDIGIRERKGGV